MDDEIKLDTTKARQGTTLHKVRYVLAGGLILAVIAFAILMNIKF